MSAKNDPKIGRNVDQLLQNCLSAFIRAGTLDLSLDQLAAVVGTSKRMLIHYFGSRENLEENVLDLFESQLAQRLTSPEFSDGASLATVMQSLWAQLTAPESWGNLLLTMDISRRGWMGSERARAFYLKQLRRWEELFSKFLPDPQAVGELLQLLQGTILIYLITGDRKLGADTLQRTVQRLEKAAKPRWSFMR